MEGSIELLARLTNAEWAVVTSASRALARTRLQAVALPVPPVLIGADDVTHGKPDPEGYLLAARRLGMERSDCIVFEDTRPGLEAARAAGMRGIGIATTYQHTELGGAHCIADFSKTRVGRLSDGSLRLTLQCY